MKSKKVINSLKNKFSKSEFSKNVFTLISGTAIAQLIPLLIAPILSRIYTPEDFGRLALYLSIVQILGSIANGRYELAIILPKEKEKGVQLTILSILITICLSIVFLVITLFFSLEIALALGDKKLGKWLYLVPLSVSMIGVFNALNYFNTREKAFKNIAKANVFKAFGGNITQLTLGFIKSVSGGLIIGQVFSHFFGNLKMAKTFFKNKKIINSITRAELKEVALRYINFPKFSMWGIFLNTASINGMNFFISSTYNLTILGHFSNAYRYLGLPSMLVGNSISQVYMQNLTTALNEKLDITKIFIATFKKLLFISLIFLVLGLLFVKDVFVIYLGKEWYDSGVYAQILIPLFALRFIVSSLSISIIVIEEQKKELFIHLLILVSTIAVIVTAILLKLNIKVSITIYSFILFLTYMYILLYIYILVKRKNSKK
ncbi:oligosaccharide flippase family protein [Cellulophaga lytica]|nr:oligosaccharide flippase family protein [Cellulophaga lytica]